VKHESIKVYQADRGKAFRDLPAIAWGLASRFMNNDFEDFEEKQAGAHWLPVLLSVLALLLAGAGLFFGLDSSRRIVPISESLEDGLKGAVDIEERLEEIEVMMESFSETIDSIQLRQQRMAAYSGQNEEVIRQLAEAINTNREAIVKSAEASSGASPNAQIAGEAGAASSGETGTSQIEADGSYAIEAGDTFAKIAQQSGISLQALLDANPGVDPRRLRIGQIIVLPTN